MAKQTGKYREIRVCWDNIPATRLVIDISLIICENLGDADFSSKTL
jgi:hypothetical protein